MNNTPDMMMSRNANQKGTHFLLQAKARTLSLRDIYKNGGRVFAVYITPNQMLEQFPDIYGWLEHWCWIDEDPDRPGAPIEWSERYEIGEVWAADTA